MTSLLPRLTEVMVVEGQKMSCHTCVYADVNGLLPPCRNCELLRFKQCYMTPAAALHYQLTGEVDHDLGAP